MYSPLLFLFGAFVFSLEASLRDSAVYLFLIIPIIFIIVQLLFPKKSAPEPSGSGGATDLTRDAYFFS
jgi:hypothetical protein